VTVDVQNCRQQQDGPNIELTTSKYKEKTMEIKCIAQYFNINVARRV